MFVFPPRKKIPFEDFTVRRVCAEIGYVIGDD